MLDVRLLIQQAANDCAVTLITDVTGLYSSSNTGGWGAPNQLPADVVITVIRIGPDGSQSSIVLHQAIAGEQHKICNTWRFDSHDLVDPDPCGCGGTFYEASVPSISDGCYTYKTVVTRVDTGAFIEASEQIVPQFCYTRQRIRRIAMKLGTDCGLGVDTGGKLCQWALAWDKFQSIIELPEVDCVTATKRLEQINTLLNGIDS